MHKAIVTKIKVTRHPDENVNFLSVGHVFGETLIVGINTPDGELGLYFPCDLQISEAFAKANDLIRRKNPETGNPEGGMFELNRRVKAIKLRGVNSNGFFCGLEALSSFGDVSHLKEGDRLDEFGGIPICCKYVSSRTPARDSSTKGKKKKELCFPEHKDTSQLKYNVGEISNGDELIITLKMHGTSQRAGYVPSERDLTWKDKVARWFGVNIKTHEMKHLNGTRRVVLDNRCVGFHAPMLREQASARIQPFIEENMIVYFEVVGYEPDGAPIMPIHSTGKLRDKKMKKKYGEAITYSYGCPESTHDLYVYRICYVLPNGKMFDLTWDEVKNKCELWGVKHTPELYRIKISEDYEGRYSEKLNIEQALGLIDNLSDGPDPIDMRHIREGVCIRINKPGWHVWKNKSFAFKVMEGIVKDDQEDYFDLEEES